MRKAVLGGEAGEENLETLGEAIGRPILRKEQIQSLGLWSSFPLVSRVALYACRSVWTPPWAPPNCRFSRSLLWVSHDFYGAPPTRLLGPPRTVSTCKLRAVRLTGIKITGQPHLRQQGGVSPWGWLWTFWWWSHSLCWGFPGPRSFPLGCRYLLIVLGDGSNRNTSLGWVYT